MSADDLTVYQVLERATARAACNQPSLMMARATWERHAGIVHNDEPLYEERAAAFLEWFLIEWRPEGGETPIAALVRGTQGREAELLATLAASHRSIFRVREPLSDGVLLDDLWGGAEFSVRERRRLAGLSVGELFDARLAADIDHPPRVLFTRSFCFHPLEAEPAIRQQIERARKAGEPRTSLLFRLLERRVKWERYRHVPPARIYAATERRP